MGSRDPHVDAWVRKAKTGETRAKRLANAVQWLSEGKSRHWKYEKC